MPALAGYIKRLKKSLLLRKRRQQAASWGAVDHYIDTQLIPSDPALEMALKDAEAAGMPPHNVTASQGKLFQLIAQTQGAKRILEVGTLAGYSAIWWARAVGAGGKVITLEVNPDFAKVAKANIARAGVDDIVELRLGYAWNSLPQLIAEKAEPFDIIFIDADKQSTADYFSWALQLARSGTLIIVDNVIRNGAVIDAASPDPSVKGIRRFYEAVKNEPRVSATAIQTVGSKGHDGFALLRVL